MSKSNLYDNSFDPYDQLMRLDARMREFEIKHNMLSREYARTQEEFSQLLESHHHLQNAVLAMSKVVGTGLLNNFPLK